MNTANSREERAFFDNDDIQLQSGHSDLGNAEACFYIIGTNEAKQQVWADSNIKTEDFDFVP